MALQHMGSYNMTFPVILGDILPFHNCKIHSSHRQVALGYYNIFYIHKNTARNLWALFLILMSVFRKG